MQLLLFVLGGLTLSSIFHFTGIHNERWYSLATATLLAIGLYSSTYGISLNEARQHLKLILSAVTIGVVLKAFIIGTIVTIFLQNPFGYLLGIILAQIDPLSTAALQKGKRLSPRAKTILGAWASFDDPITVILALYTPALLASFVDINNRNVGGMVIEGGLTGYVTITAINLAFAAVIFFLWSLLKRHTQSPHYSVLFFTIIGAYVLLFATFSIAIYYFLMLGVALIGLFMRPKIEKIIDITVNWALFMAAILLGILLVNGVNIIYGIILGSAAFLAQIIVGYILCRKLPKKDRIHIAFAQQNGITAIILALLFESYYAGTIAIVAPAILVTNTIHLVANKTLDLHHTKKLSFAVLLPKLQTLKKHL